MKNSIKIVIILFLFIMTFTMAVSVSAQESIQADEYDIFVSSLGLSDINTTGVLSNSEITTTDGSPITTEEKYDTTFLPGSLETIDNWAKSYGIKREIVEIAPPNNLYNSHSYAWYQADSDYDQYWIVSPAPFINDAHRWVLNEDTATVGDIIVYCSGSEYLHSAVICDIEYENGEKVFICESKWELFGVYEHRWDELPYEYYVLGNDGKPMVEYYRYTQGAHETTYTSADSFRHIEDCEKCEYTEYAAHNIMCMTVSTTRHRYICRDCDYARYESHTPQYIVYSEEEHKVRCSGCGYTIFADHNLYLYERNDDDPSTIMCSDCGYIVDWRGNGRLRERRGERTLCYV